MQNRNCPNCGAPYDVGLNKCPYCGTSYYDLSALDLTAREPFYLKIKTEMNGAPCYITQLVRPRAEMVVELNCETVEAQNGFGNGNGVCSFVQGHTLTTNISFEAVTSPTHENLITIEMEK